MTGEIVTTVVGGLGGDPDLKYVNAMPVVNFSVASSPRVYDKDADAWKDGEVFWMRCALWREAAENVANSLHKGDRVIVTGRLKQRSYDKDGQTHTVVEMDDMRLAGITFPGNADCETIFPVAGSTTRVRGS